MLVAEVESKTMALSETCGACGCDLKDQPKGATRHGAHVYCAECAALILSPEELMPPKPATPPRAIVKPAPPPAPPKPVGKATKAAIASLDDDWFAPPKGQKPGEATVEMAEPPKIVDKTSGVRASRRPPPPQPIPVEPLAPMAPVAEIDEAEEGQEHEDLSADLAAEIANPGEVPEQAPVAEEDGDEGEVADGDVVDAEKAPPRKLGKKTKGKKGSLRDTRDSRQADAGSKRSKSARLPARPVEKAEKSGPLAKAEKSSSRASGRASARTSGRSSARGKAAEPENDRDSLRKGKSKSRGSGEGISSTMMIGIGVGLVVFILLCVAAFGGGGGGGSADKKSGKPALSEEDTDRTPSNVYADQARARQNAGDIPGAAEQYVKAANAAEREGKPQQAQKYTTISYDLKKNLHLDLAGSRR